MRIALAMACGSGRDAKLHRFNFPPCSSSMFFEVDNVNDKDISILVVDDDVETTKMLCQLIGVTLTAQHHCFPAGNVEEATRLLDATFFHLVITDINMPGTTGISL